MPETARKEMTVEEFFTWQQRQDRKYELVDGAPVLISKANGVTDQHDRITVNAIACLGRQLRGTGYNIATSNISVRTVRGTRRPDLFAERGGKSDRHAMDATDPRVILEVASPSTLRFDHFEKLADYQRHPSIEVVLLIDSEAPRVVIWRRGSNGWTPEQAVGPQATILLPEIDAILPLSELYDNVTFEA